MGCQSQQTQIHHTVGTKVPACDGSVYMYKHGLEIVIRLGYNLEYQVVNYYNITIYTLLNDL